MKADVFLFLIAILLFVAGCTGSPRDIKASDFMVESVSPSGLRGIDAVIGVTIDNPAAKFSVQESLATIKIAGDPLLLLSSDSLTVFRRGSQRYHIPVHGEINEGFSLFSLVPLLGGGDVSKCTVDLEFRAGIGKFGKKFRFDDIPIQKLINRF